MKKIEIKLHKRWVQNPHYQQTEQLNTTTNVNNIFHEIRDHIDIEVNDKNLIAIEEPEPIFLLLGDILGKVSLLINNETNKVSILLYENPYEMVLLRENNEFYLSFFQTGKITETLIHNELIDIFEFIKNIKSQSLEIIKKIETLMSFIRNHFVLKEIKENIKKLKLVLTPQETTNSEDETEVAYIGKWDSTDNSKDFLVGGKVIFTSKDLFTLIPDNKADIHSLLFTGKMSISYNNNVIKLPEGFLFFDIETIIRSFRAILGAIENQKPLIKRVITNNFIIDFHVTKDQQLSVNFGNLGDLHPFLSINKTEPIKILKPFLSFGKSLIARIEKTAPHQKHNLKIKQFMQEIDTLKEWLIDLNQPTIINENTNIYRVTLQDKKDISPDPIYLSDIKKLSYINKWNFELEGLILDDIYLTEKKIILANNNNILGLNRDSGELLWETDRDPGKLLLAANKGIINIDYNGKVEMFSLENGISQWSSQILPRAGGALNGIISGGFKGPRSFVAIEGQKRLTALDINSGQVLWNFESSRGSNFHLVNAGRLLIFTSGDTSVYALDADRGNLVWRYSLKTRLNNPPIICGQKVIVYDGDELKNETNLYALDLPSGKLMWKLELKKASLIYFFDNKEDIFLCWHDSDENTILANVSADSGEILWEVQLDNDLSSIHSMLVYEDCLFIHWSGKVTKVSIEDGSFVWEKELSLPQWMSTISSMNRKVHLTLRGGALFVPEDQVYILKPGNGDIIHELGNETIFPEKIFVDEKFNIYIAEDGGVAGCYSVTSQFRVIK